MKRIIPALLCLVLLLLAAVPALAAGPHDGFYSVVETHPTLGQFAFFASIHQNDAFLSQGFNVLFNTVQFGGSWTIGLGVMSGNVVSGNFFDYFGRFAGTFSGAFTDPIHFQGQIFYATGSVTSFFAERLF